MIYARAGWRVLPAAVLVDLLHRLVDAAEDLAMRGYLFDPYEADLGPAEWTHDPGVVLGQLAVIAAGCGICRLSPAALAGHWLEDERVRIIRAWPVWLCGCGAGYKRFEGAFYTITPDGLLGKVAGRVEYNSKNEIKRSDACLGCGVKFSATIRLQETPEGALF